MTVFNNCAVLIISVTIWSIFSIGINSEEISINPNTSYVSRDEGSGNRAAVGTPASEAAVMALHKDASESIANGAPSLVVSAIERGLKTAIEMIAASSNATDKSLASARENVNQNPEAAIKAIETGIMSAQRSIRAVDIPVYYSFDEARANTGNGSKIWILKGLKLARHSRKYGLAGLSATGVLSINGLRSNSAAAEKGLVAAKEAAKTGYDAAYASLVLAARSTFRGLLGEITNSRTENTTICITPPTSRSEESKAAENEITFRAQQAMQSVNQTLVANAIAKTEEFLKCAIRTVAAGEALALKAISVATELASNESEIATVTFKAGLKALKRSIITAGNITSQGLNEVELNLGNQKTNKFVLAILKVRNGVTSALYVLESAKNIPSIGFKIGGDVAVQGLRAFHKSALAVLFEFYSLLVTIGEEAF